MKRRGRFEKDDSRQLSLLAFIDKLKRRERNTAWNRANRVRRNAMRLASYYGDTKNWPAYLNPKESPVRASCR